MESRDGAATGTGILRSETGNTRLCRLDRRPAAGTERAVPYWEPFLTRRLGHIQCPLGLGYLWRLPRLAGIIWGGGPSQRASPMTDVTRILSAIEQGDPAAAEQLLPLVYDELRRLAAQRMAQERPGQTIQATALVHEAYIRLVNAEEAPHWNSRGHFFTAAAEAMRRILIDRARDKKRAKRGGQRRRIDLEAIDVALNTADDDLLDLDEALEKLASEYPECAELVKLRFFAGMSLGEAAVALGLARRTAYRHWAYARAWLYQQLCLDDHPAGS